VSVTSILLDILIVLVAAKVAAEIAERVGFPPVVAVSVTAPPMLSPIR
jgi:Kef-type K+ transport system membrane component KefB